MVHLNFVCNFVVVLEKEWRQNQWSRLRPLTWWLVDPQEECHALLGHWPPQLTLWWSITQQNTIFLSWIDKASGPRSKPQSTYSVGTTTQPSRIWLKVSAISQHTELGPLTRTTSAGTGDEWPSTSLTHGWSLSAAKNLTNMRMSYL